MSRNIQRTQKSGQMRYTLLKGCLALLPLLSLAAVPVLARSNAEKMADVSENGGLTLRITDALTGEPIPGAVVKTSDAKIYVTDASGNCVMTVKDQTKKIKITVTSVGYKNYTATLSPSAGVVSVKLSEDAQILKGVTAFCLFLLGSLMVLILSRKRGDFV
jgi:iron complex outermembrane recepter protein